MYENEEWDGTLEGLFNSCPWGGLGNYALLDTTCEWKCRFREACIKAKKEAQQRASGKIWRRLFMMEDRE